MAGGGQGPAPAQGDSGSSLNKMALDRAAFQASNPQATMQQVNALTAPPPQNMPTKPMMLDQTAPAVPPEWANAQLQQMQRGAGPLPTGGHFGGMTSQGRSYADGGQVGMSNYASPNQNFMQYPQQGQPNQPPQTQSSVLPSTAFMGGPDSGADYAPANMGFDGSGSDGGVGGQPAPMQTPLGATSAGMNSGLPQVQGNKPLGLAQFQQPQGLQIAGNPTSQIVQRPQQR